MPVIEVDEELYLILMYMRQDKLADRAIRNYAKWFIGFDELKRFAEQLTRRGRERPGGQRS